MCLKMLLDSRFAFIWSISFSVQVPAIVGYHSVAWLSLGMWSNLKNVLVKPFTELIADVLQIVRKKSLRVNARNGSLSTYENQASDSESTCLAQHRHNSRFFCHLENCVLLAWTISKHPTPGYSNDDQIFRLLWNLWYLVQQKHLLLTWYCSSYWKSFAWWSIASTKFFISPSFISNGDKYTFWGSTRGICFTLHLPTANSSREGQRVLV